MLESQLQPRTDLHRPLPTLRQKVMKIGAKAARRGRFIAFQMAEVAVPWSLFAEIPRLSAEYDQDWHRRDLSQLPADVAQEGTTAP